MGAGCSLSAGVSKGAAGGLKPVARTWLWRMGRESREGAAPIPPKQSVDRAPQSTAGLTGMNRWVRVGLGWPPSFLRESFGSSCTGWFSSGSKKLDQGMRHRSRISSAVGGALWVVCRSLACLGNQGLETWVRVQRLKIGFARHLISVRESMIQRLLQKLKGLFSSP